MMATIAHAVTESGQSPIQSALRLHNRLFFVYMALILLVAAFTYLVWQSGNKLQGAVQSDALARIEEAKSVAAKADEHAKALEKDNWTLRSQVATLETNAANASKDLAGLQKAAADAKAAQQKVEIDLARQQERTATAEKNLLELQERVKLRRLSAEQRKKLIDFLHTPDAAAIPNGPITVSRLFMDETGAPFAGEIKEAFDAAGWPNGPVGKDTVPNGPMPIGIVVMFHSAESVPKHAGVIQHALIAAGLEPALGENPNIPEGVVEILVGIKP